MVQLCKITSGTVSQIQSVIDKNIIPSLIQMLKYAVHNIQRQAIIAICNAITGGSVEQIKFLVSEGCGKIAVAFRYCGNYDIQFERIAMSGLEKILHVGIIDLYGLPLEISHRFKV